jgi:hypothetical protein
MHKPGHIQRPFVLYSQKKYWRCDFDGKNNEKIFSLDREIETLWGIKTYRGYIYIAIDREDVVIARFDPKNKTVKTIAKDVDNPCFCGDVLYYGESGEVGINKVDLKTGKKQLIRGKRSEKKDKYEDFIRYAGIIAHKGEMYYLQWNEGNKENQIGLYKYQENGKDIRQKEFSNKAYKFVYDSSTIVGFHTRWDDPDKSYIQVYDLIPERKRR